MKKFIIEDLLEVAESMYFDITEDNETGYDVVTFAGYYEDTMAVLKHLLMFDDTVPCHISITDVDICGYKKEYFVTLDSDMNILCWQAYDCENNRYLELYTDCLYVADDCNSSLLKRINCPKEEMYEVSYDLDDECECNGHCESCQCSKDDNQEIVTRVAVDKDGTIRGFEKSWSTHEDGMYYHSTYTHYSNNPDMLKQMMDNFDIKF